MIESKRTITREDDYNLFKIREKLANKELLNAADYVYLDRMKYKLRNVSKEELLSNHSIISEVLGSYILITLIIDDKDIYTLLQRYFHLQLP